MRSLARWLIPLLPALALAPCQAEEHPETAATSYPPFSVLPRAGKVEFFPCDHCHEIRLPNPRRRRLRAPHVKEVLHGGGRIWCLECHDVEKRDLLGTFNGETVSFDEAYRVCEQCHADRGRDWYHGGHGKRVANWQGERQLYNCTECHDAHDPLIKPRKPEPPPLGRIGLPPPRDHGLSNPALWERVGAAAD